MTIKSEDFMKDWLNLYADGHNKVLTDNKDLLDEKLLKSLLIDKEQLLKNFNQDKSKNESK